MNQWMPVPGLPYLSEMRPLWGDPRVFFQRAWEMGAQLPPATPFSGAHPKWACFPSLSYFPTPPPEAS